MSNSVIKITICQNPEDSSREVFVIWTEAAAYGFLFGGGYHTLASRGEVYKILQEFPKAAMSYFPYGEKEVEICKNTQRCVIYQKENH